jgi:hypothetical protein
VVQRVIPHLPVVTDDIDREVNVVDPAATEAVVVTVDSQRPVVQPVDALLPSLQVLPRVKQFGMPRQSLLVSLASVPPHQLGVTRRDLAPLPVTEPLRHLNVVSAGNLPPLLLIERRERLRTVARGDLLLLLRGQSRSCRGEHDVQDMRVLPLRACLVLRDLLPLLAEPPLHDLLVQPAALLEIVGARLHIRLRQRLAVLLIAHRFRLT